LWRFLGGIGIGVELVTIDTYIAELAPPAARGRAFAFANVIQFLSIPLVALLAYILVPRMVFGLDGWRVVVLIGAVGAAVVWLVRLGVPESPRWLAQHGRSEEANRIVERWEVEARLESGALIAPVERPLEAGGRGRFTEIFKPPYRSRTIMLVVFNLFQAAGYYGFASWVPTLLVAQGIAVTTSLGYTFIIAIAAPLGPLLGLLFTDRIERKWIIVWAALAIVAAGLVFARAHGAMAVIACGVALTLANNILSFAYHGYQPELFPTRIRAAAVGFVYSFSRIATMFSAFIIAFVLKDFGAPGVFLFIAGCMAVVALVIGIFGPRTSNLSLEAISK
jgi:putative MFS transporter